MLAKHEQYFPREMTPATNGHKPVLAIRKRIDFDKIHADRRSLEAELKEVKTQLHKPHTESSAALQERQRYLRREVTMIYSLLVHIRGRLHQKKVQVGSSKPKGETRVFSMTDQEQLIGSEWQVYLKPEETAISAPAA